MADSPQTSPEEVKGAALETKVAAISDNLNELHDLMALEKKLRWVLVVAVLAVILVMVFLSYKTAATNLNLAKLQPEVEKQLKPLLEEARNKLIATVKEAAPKAQAEITRRLDAHMPRIKKDLKQEYEQLLINLNKKVNEAIVISYGDIENDIKGMIRRDAPDLVNENKILLVQKNLHKAVSELTHEYVERHFSGQLGRLADIEKTIRRYDPDKSLQSYDAVMKEIENTIVAIFQLKLSRIINQDSSKL